MATWKLIVLLAYVATALAAPHWEGFGTDEDMEQMDPLSEGRQYLQTDLDMAPDNPFRNRTIAVFKVLESMFPFVRVVERNELKQSQDNDGWFNWNRIINRYFPRLAAAPATDTNIGLAAKPSAPPQPSALSRLTNMFYGSPSQSYSTVIHSEYSNAITNNPVGRFITYVADYFRPKPTTSTPAVAVPVAVKDMDTLDEAEIKGDTEENEIN